MKDLKLEIEKQSEQLATRKYLISKFPKAYSGKLIESGEDVYLVEASPEKFTNVRFLYDANKAQFVVRLYSKLKRKNKPDIVIYSTTAYYCNTKTLVNLLNEHCKNKKYEDLPSSLKTIAENTLPVPAHNAMDRNINLFASHKPIRS